VSAIDEERPGMSVDALRSIAQLDMLHHLAADLNALTRVEDIGAAITRELRTIIDYHNCRVYVLMPDGISLHPIAFRGELFSEYEHETLEELAIDVGTGITGHVAATRRSLLTPDAREVDFASQIPGTDDILESMLAVPMVAGDDLMGVIVLSSLGYGMFDDDDRRMLEVLAPHAAIAIQKASLLKAEREAAERSATLLRMSQAMTRLRTVDEILQEAIETMPSLVPCVAAAAFVMDPATGDFRPTWVQEIVTGTTRPRAEIADVPRDIAGRFLADRADPFVIDEATVRSIPREYVIKEPGEVLVAPIRWETDGVGALAMFGTPGERAFDDDSLRLARGVADIASLALGKARRISELERFQELVASLDAVFWEAEASDLAFGFIGGRASELLSADAPRWPEAGRQWGEHVLAEDRERAVDELKRAAEDGNDRSVEYRVVSANGGPVWIRDMVHVVRGAAGTRLLRGLMVDITERKRAEEALRQSERQASSAFEREREASQQLRSLDEMKNTFLEAVSHDLRTPLTAILGSALTLEQSWGDLPREDARDLVRRVAGNARKLERLLSDLLDLDRLQRGILVPQRRPTEILGLVDRVVSELEHPHHEVSLDVADVAISVDAAKVERILENLLTNAVRHTPAGSHVWVRCVPNDEGLLVIVDDDGPGIPEPMSDEVFEPFRQVPGSSSEHSPGVGIGLSLVRRFAALHGGRAWVQEREGGGASFRVLLPTE
jgi:signal transduction histidine kinase/GAF domain-containing protein